MVVEVISAVANLGFSRMDILFLFVLAGFLTHEMDALDKHEWRLLYGLRRLSDANGRQIFLWLHIPLSFAILWLTFSAMGPIQQYSRLALSLFAIVHGILHYRLRDHLNNEFDRSSHMIIFGTALFGIFYTVAAIFLSEP